MSREYVGREMSSEDVLYEERLLFAQKRNHTERCRLTEIIKLVARINANFHGHRRAPSVAI